MLARAEESYELSTPRPGWAEQDPDDWVRAAEAALGRVDATSVGLSGQMHGLVALDADDRPLRPAILWNDQRTAAECAEIERRLGLERLIELTGNRALTGFTAPKLLWLREHEPDVVRADRARPPAEGLRAAEALRRAGDRRRRCIRDAAPRRRAPPLERGGARRVGDPAAWLPPVFESPEVRRSAGDQAAAALGVGVDDPGHSRSSSGRPGSSSRRCRSTQPIGKRACMRSATRCRSLARDGRDALGRRLTAVAAGRDRADVDFEVLVAEAERWPPGCEGLMFAPYLAGERTPHADPNVRGAFVGLSLRHDRGALVRAVLEGVAYGLRDSLELLRELGVEPDVGRISGGGARSALWRTIVASVLDLPVERRQQKRAPRTARRCSPAARTARSPGRRMRSTGA